MSFFCLVPIIILFSLFCIGSNATAAVNISCDSDDAIDCAHCDAYAPCVNSIDPHCITHDALDCLSCSDYEICAPCAPGWDIGCMSAEWFSNTTECDASKDPSEDNLYNSLNETISIPFLMNGECYFHAVFEAWITYDCTLESDTVTICNDTNCTGDCSSDSIHISSDYFNVNISFEVNAICKDSWPFSDDDNDTWSALVWGICGDTSMVCPSGQSCGPAACDPSMDEHCVEIEIFDQDSVCNATSGAGDYSGYVYGNNTCLMDGSGRSYYQVGCINGNATGVIGCSEDTCSLGCTYIGSFPPNECYTSDDWLANLQIAVIGDANEFMCNQTSEPYTTTPASEDSGSDGDDDGPSSTSMNMSSTDDASGGSDGQNSGEKSGFCVSRVVCCFCLLFSVFYFL